MVQAGLLKAVPADPYAAGQRIKFARTADGLIVYSTGTDGVDHGGKLDRSSYPPKPDTDRGLQLWDVAARRQPPLPPKPADGDADPNGPSAQPQAAPPGGGPP